MADLSLPQTKRKLYRIWAGMKSRCYCASLRCFHNYGGRGIAVCPEWKDDYIAFEAWAESNGYAPKLTIDRKDTNGPYAPWNCRWATVSEQMQNIRTNVYLTAFGERKTLTAWSRDQRCHVTLGALCSRIKRGMAPETAMAAGRKPLMLTAFGETKGCADWARDPRCVVQRGALFSRIEKGMAPEQAITTPLQRIRTPKAPLGTSPSQRPDSRAPLNLGA